MLSSDLVSYFLTLMAIALAPGPVALMLLVRSARNDILGATGLGVGFAFGGVIILIAVCFGLGSALTSFPAVFEYGKYVMMAYILWLAYGIWNDGFDLTGDHQPRSRAILGALGVGVMSCAISPYMMILFPLLLPNLMDITTVEISEFLVIAVITLTALFGGSVIIITFAAQIRRIARSPRSMMLLNRGLAGVLTFGGGWMAFM